MRISEKAVMAAFREKMKTEEAQQIYRKRGPVAEFPNCWLKEKIGLRKFPLARHGESQDRGALGGLNLQRDAVVAPQLAAEAGRRECPSGLVASRGERKTPDRYGDTEINEHLATIYRPNGRRPYLDNTKYSLLTSNRSLS